MIRKSYYYGILAAAGIFAVSCMCAWPIYAEQSDASADTVMEELLDDAADEPVSPAESSGSGDASDQSAQAGEAAEDAVGSQEEVEDLIEDSHPTSGKGMPQGLSIAAKVQETDPENQVQEPMVTVDPSKYPAASFSENAREVYWYCRLQLGLNHAAACGVLGNVHLESSFRPLALGDGGTSYGICQWHLGRLTNLMSYCESEELDYNTLEGQLEFLRYELEGRYNGFYEAMKEIEDTPEGAREAGWLMCVYFEMPDQADARGVQRGNLAMNNYYPKDFFETASFTTAQKVFVKTAATVVSEDAGQLPEDTEVSLIALQDGWAQIEYEQEGVQQNGYIPARLLVHIKESDDLIGSHETDISDEEKIETDTSREDTEADEKKIETDTSREDAEADEEETIDE